MINRTDDAQSDFTVKRADDDTIQKANVELVASLKKAHPGKSNKEIADLAKDALKIPDVPYGLTTEQFHKAQQLIKEFLQTKGVTVIEGFATGSRVTGTTFNPKKSTFGEMITDFSKRDFDITLVTNQKISRNQTKVLQDWYFEEFHHRLGIRNVVDTRQLEYIPIYGKIDMRL
jgi:hypothetical protein